MTNAPPCQPPLVKLVETIGGTGVLSDAPLCPLGFHHRILKLPETHCSAVVPGLSGDAYSFSDVMPTCLDPISFLPDPTDTQKA